MTYQLEGNLLEVCTCKAICPCWVGEDPDGGSCKGTIAYQIENGTIDGVDVSGLTLGLLADIPGNAMAGNWKVAIFVDDRATAEQEEALLAAFTGKKGGPLVDVAQVVGEVVSIERAQINADVTEGNGSLQICPGSLAKGRTVVAVLVVGGSARALLCRLLLGTDAADVCGGHGQPRLDAAAGRSDGSREKPALGAILAPTPGDCSFVRRQALLEIDVLVALTLDELQTIYRVQLPVMRQYEIADEYDAHGRLIPSTHRKSAGDKEVRAACQNWDDESPLTVSWEIDGGNQTITKTF